MSELAVEPGGPAAAAAAADEAAPPGPAGDQFVVPEPVVVEPPAPAPAGIDYNAPEFLEAVQAQAAYVADQRLQQFIAEAQAEAMRQQQTAGLDPSMLVDELGNVDPGALAGLIQQSNQQMLQAVQQMIQGLAAPLAAREQAETLAEGEQRLADILTDDIARNGEFSPDPKADARARQMVREQSDRVFDELASRFGGAQAVIQAGLGPRLAEAAMSQAAADVRELFSLVGGSVLARQQNQAATLAGAPREPGVGAGAGVVTTTADIGSPRFNDDLALRYSQRISARNGQ
jgi:hypothetical protein